MRRVLLAMFATAALVAAGSVASNADPTDASGHHKRSIGHNVIQPGGSFTTGFSSSSVLHVGVNRPPKNR